MFGFDDVFFLCTKKLQKNTLLGVLGSITVFATSTASRLTGDMRVAARRHISSEKNQELMNSVGSTSPVYFF